VENKNNSPVTSQLSIRFVAKTSDIKIFSENIRFDVKTSEVATLTTVVKTTFVASLGSRLNFSHHPSVSQLTKILPFSL